MKKFLVFFAGVCMIALTAVTLTSCGDDDEGNILKGTTWSGSITLSEGNSSFTSNLTLEFTSTTYRVTAGVGTGMAGGNYSLSEDNKTVYMDAQQGQTIGKISADGKTMTLSNTVTKISGTLTKQ